MSDIDGISYGGLIVGVTLNDHADVNVMETIQGSDGAFATFQLSALGSFGADWTAPTVLPTDGDGSQPTDVTGSLTSGLLSAISTYLTGYDWTTAFADTWTDNSIPTPVSVAAVTVWQPVTNAIDVTP